MLCALTQIILHFRNAFTTKHKLLIFDNKQMVKVNKLLKYYSYKTAKIFNKIFF